MLVRGNREKNRNVGKKVKRSDGRMVGGRKVVVDGGGGAEWGGYVTGGIGWGREGERKRRAYCSDVLESSFLYQRHPKLIYVLSVRCLSMVLYLREQ